MSLIRLICVGKLKERFYLDAVAEYSKRLSRFCRLEIIELPEQRLPEDPSPAQIRQALEREAEAVRAKIPPGAWIAAMCIEGRLCSSEELAALLAARGGGGEKSMVFLIGGSHGLAPALKEQANARLSMSPMTFPHHLARVMLLEQIYRGFQINTGTRYHK